MFAARGIHAVVGAEHHASLLGPLGASFLSLDIWVDEEDAEEAAELLRDLRERAVDAPFEGEDGEGDDQGDDAEEDQGDHAIEARLVEPPALAGDSLRMQIERRRRTAAVLLLGCFVTFGTAHMFTRAWVRGVALACIEGMGLWYAVAGAHLSGLLVAAAVAYDLVGALWRVRHHQPSASTIPVARIHSSGPSSTKP
jgi:hypothetical protein